jgi:3-dehydroquinate synthase
MVAESIAVKQRIVSEDPHEKGLRKALNLGHTVGHALESLALEEGRPVLHGYAVAWGLVAELFMSVGQQGFPQEEMRRAVSYIHQYYGRFAFSCDHYEHLYALMLHDKKNVGTQINFTLLDTVGSIALDCHVTKDDVFEAFDFVREG